MTAVDSSEAGKKSSKARKRNSRRKKEKKRLKSKFRLSKRLDKYRKILEATKAARVKASSKFTFGVNLPRKLLEISSRIVTSPNTSTRQFPPSPFPINPQQAMSGNCFWLNYQSVFHWKDRHTNNLSAHSFPGLLKTQMVHPPNPQIYQENLETHSPEGDGHQNDDPRGNDSPAGSSYYEAEDSAVEGKVDFEQYEDVGQNEEGNESDDDYVLTEEMMQFLEINMRHKFKREREKLAGKELERKRQTEERDTIEDCQVPTEDDENEKRLREMSELYGKEAPKIHGMETALQLNFNRQLDLFNPSYWPFYPFSMQFKGVTALK